LSTPTLTAPATGGAVLHDPAARHAGSVQPVGWSILRNSVAQIAGRLFVAASRLVVASLILRSAGTEVFGQYSLVFSLLAIADWLVDLGTTDVFVRDISREPGRATQLMRMLTATKLVQIPASFLVLGVLLLASGYPTTIVAAGMVGGTSVVCFAAVVVYRVIFRVTLTTERDVAAELLSVLVMIPLVAFVARAGGGLVALSACHVASRAAYCVACYLFGRSRYRPSLDGVTWPDIRWSLRASAAIGTIGFLVAAYEVLDVALLARLATFSEVAYYSAAQRLVWPALMALAAVAAVFYPVIASHWPHSRVRFESTSQRSLDVVFTLAGCALCPMLAAAEFLMGLLGPELAPGAPVLQVLAALCLMKAITSSVGPVFYIVGAQKQALQFIAAAVALKAGVVAVLAPRFGALGVAIGGLVVEAGVAAVAVTLIQRIAQFRIRWRVIVTVAVVCAAASAASRLFVPGGGLAAGLVALALYVLLALAARAVRLSDVRALVRERR
jgi:O-antigen/teichoic acid export membrane protein